MKEKLLTDFDEAATDIYNQITKTLSSASFIIFGHSLGAYLALIVAGMLENNNYHPAYVFVSGATPASMTLKKNRYLLKDADFLHELQKMGGMPKELINDVDFQRFFLPILRADFKLVEKFNIEQATTLKAPIYAFIGSDEENIKEIQQWEKFTCSSFQYKIMQGDHFFLFNHATEIGQIIKQMYIECIVLRYQ